jgi:hypothetical protein
VRRLRFPGALVTACIALVAFAPAALAVVPEGNLVVDPGAEDVVGANDTVAKPAVPGWTSTGSFTAVRYGAPGYPTPEDGSRTAGDKNFFAGGPSAPVSTGEQAIDVSGAASEIDTGTIGFTLSAFLGGYSSQRDNASVTANFKDGLGNVGGTQTIGPVATADRNSITGFEHRSASGAVPAGTRSIQIIVTATRVDGSYNDGYADNVNMTLGPQPPPPVFAKTIEATPVFGTVLVQVPGSKTFVPLANVRTLPVGSVIDARKGRVRLEAANGKGGFSFADFYEGVFKLLQKKTDKGIVQLDLFGASFKSCGKGGIAADKKSKSIRHLWGQGSGKFRTSGRFATATLRGTTWLTDDQCGGTLVRVTVGSVTVRDIPKKKNVVVTAPNRYLAKAKR